MNKKIVLNIKGMHCSSCAMNIDGELEDLGVKNSQTNYAAAQTEVEFDEAKVSIETIQNTIAGLGYSSELKN